MSSFPSIFSSGDTNHPYFIILWIRKSVTLSVYSVFKAQCLHRFQLNLAYIYFDSQGLSLQRYTEQRKAYYKSVITPNPLPSSIFLLDKIDLSISVTVKNKCSHNLLEQLIRLNYVWIYGFVSGHLLRNLKLRSTYKNDMIY